MSNITSKEYLKTLIVRGLKGEKIGQQESAALEKEMANFTAADWRNFKIIGKEIIKEEVNKYVDKSEKIPVIWKSEIKSLVSAGINFSSAIFSEEIIMESMRLEKEKVPFEQRIKSLAPLLTSQLEKIAARKTPYKPKNYHKAEKSFAKRYQTIKFLVGVGSLKGKETPSESEIKNYLKKLLRSCKNFSADEIKVLKEKGKAWINDSLATSQILQSPESQGLFKALVNFWDAVLEEELLAESTNFVVELFEIAVETLNLEDIKELSDKNNPWDAALYGASLGKKIEQKISESSLLNRGHSLATKLTNHLNRLAGEEEINSRAISPSEEQAINQRIAAAQELSDKPDNSDNKTGSGLSSLAPSNLLEGGDFRGGQFWFGKVR